MRIGGLQKTSMLDFPQKVSAVVFTKGCNFTCPYCHNPDLVLYRRDPLALADVIAFLTKRRRVLEGVVISGGEPTLHDGLFSFCATVKSLGYAVKLDTNGSRPNVLRGLLEANLLDYVAMDIKADPDQYPAEICAEDLGKNILRSMALLAESQVAHEFRVPCVAPFINQNSFQAILNKINQKTSIFLQQVALGQVLSPDFFTLPERQPLALEEIKLLEKIGTSCGHMCSIR